MLITNATLADGRCRDVRIADGTITELGRTLAGDADVDASGKLLLPGMIDAHVHFRQPGYDHKETWETGSQSAAAGGVTTVVDQPNTSPPTVSGEAFDEKAAFAAQSYVDWGINGGVTENWDRKSLLSRPLFALGEVFLADSTGNMGIAPVLFEDAVKAATKKGVAVTVHAEDATLFDESAKDRDDADAWSAFRAAEAEAEAVELACKVGEQVGAQLHIAHTSTPEGVDIAADYGMTCEVSPHHLLLSRADLEELGTFGRMNPPLRSEQRRAAVYKRVADGTVDMIATDHAPHTREEKDASIWDAPSGVPGVETALPLLLEEARKGNLTYERVRQLTASNPAAVFDLPKKGRVAVGMDADLVLVDPDASREIRGVDLHSKCDWTPFEGMRGVFPEWTMVRGETVFDDGAFGEAVGENVR
ncbi:dihydroorotase [Haladaptatus sp. DJG-WS-42]|uniref:dihydroorotase n=1 Tax=Haladaptatus sp. DJG-WS-42 TaxID=3120516 RepID=UPI0030CAC5BB